ncbi:hypothetical protein KQX63_13440 [Rhodopseudomonas palustris]|nr:hypothetical protein KQX63_13440 [Rhodopseudomonas palustris]
MHTFLDAKLMAKSLRQALAVRKVKLSHSDCLELVANQFGLPDWNTLAAKIDAAVDERPLRLPRDWLMSNQAELNYRAGLDPSHSGAVLIESKLRRESGNALTGQSATLMQSILSENFKNQRVRFSALLRTEDVDAASIWLRVDRGPGNVISFDNMMHRRENGALRGSHGWTKCESVLEVPDFASAIHYGLILHGYGRVEGRGFRLETVGKAVAITAQATSFLQQPSNLDFSEGDQSSAA